MNHRHVRILVVDEPNTCAFLAKILSLRPWHVDTACDGQTALELVHKHHYDIVLLDCSVPGMDGAELCGLIREIQPGIRGVFLTGYPTIDTVYPAIEAGGERVLSKPVDPEELLAVLEAP